MFEHTVITIFKGYSEEGIVAFFEDRWSALTDFCFKISHWERSMEFIMICH